MSPLTTDRTQYLRFLSGTTVIEVAARIWTTPDPRGTLFCIHGFAGTGQDFAFLAATLRGHGIETVAIDMPGRGASTFLGNPALYSLKLVQTVLAEAIKLVHGPFILAGTSWGGVIAANMALHLRASCRGLVLVDTPLVSTDTSDHPHEDFIRDEALRTFSSAQSAHIYYAATRNLHHLSRADLDDLLAVSIMPFENGFRMRYDPALMQSIGRRRPFNLTADLATAPFPILAVTGAHSHLALSATQIAARAAIPTLTNLTCAHEAHPPSLSRTLDLHAISAFVTGCLTPPA
jgi:pimeloyl-ACP methyl ester carboxylesterase